MLRVDGPDDVSVSGLVLLSIALSSPALLITTRSAAFFRAPNKMRLAALLLLAVRAYCLRFGRGFWQHAASLRYGLSLQGQTPAL
ncbi:MAG: hypothetical protein ACXWIN_03200 [Burkholderiaceae bacterium]